MNDIINDPIEYRAWQPHASLHRQPGMYEVTGLEFYPSHGGGEAFLALPGEQPKSSEYFEDIVLMRWTGLRDRNGVKIFDGDIIESTAPTDLSAGPMKVVWHRGYFGVTNDDFEFEPLMIHARVSGVVGDIYRSPERLHG